MRDIIDTTKVEKKLSDITIVVRDFSYVFPDELPRVILDKEVEFSIELLPGTTLISIAPYRMAPYELRELKVQLQDLLEILVYSAKCVTLGCTSSVCQEEGWHYAIMYRL